MHLPKTIAKLGRPSLTRPMKEGKVVVLWCVVCCCCVMWGSNVLVGSWQGALCDDGHHEHFGTLHCGGQWC